MSFVEASAILSCVVGLLTIIGVGVKIVGHLASFDAKATAMKEDLDEIRSDSKLQWEKFHAGGKEQNPVTILPFIADQLSAE